MLTSALFVSYLTCLVSGNMAPMTSLSMPVMVHQDKRFISANVGENVTLECVYRGTDSAWLSWYQQLFHQEPKLISTFHSYDKEASLQDAFENDQRFAIKRGNGFSHLRISSVKSSDSGTYFCATSSLFVLKFAEGATVTVKEAGSTVVASIDQSVSGSFRQGGSLNLSCAVHTRSCDEEHSVYWFKNSGEPHSKVVYGSRTDQKKPSAHARGCVHHMSLKSLDPSHVGTYYCAVVACGHILFGNGTALDFDREGKMQILVYSLIGALTLSFCLVVLLCGLIYKINHRNCSQSTGVRFSAPLTTITEDENQETEDVNYAALSVRPGNRSGAQKKTATDDCVYSAVKK